MLIQAVFWILSEPQLKIMLVLKNKNIDKISVYPLSCQDKRLFLFCQTINRIGIDHGSAV